SRRRHTRFSRDWSSDVCSSDLFVALVTGVIAEQSAILQGRIGDARYAATAAALAAMVKRAEKALTAADLYQIRFNRIAETIDNRSEERRVGKEGSERVAHDHET